ncbi:hypothetical protein CBR_g45407 [Chara braunii]|uniref:Rhamnogalacturonase A/B/Epimerase-like pectate lyase domain-containing protein n=1 Tax=Chara braunii TaxID=69332 RepID=A0A388LYF1_CHABU|nr:hypothetical protein CBR_g45407 [Chara braunii]|eukprot:GBG87347.1 hypothetical protein CBR_g45407 [Chara braunii]
MDAPKRRNSVQLGSGFLLLPGAGWADGGGGGGGGFLLLPGAGWADGGGGGRGRGGGGGGGGVGLGVLHKASEIGGGVGVGGGVGGVGVGRGGGGGGGGGGGMMGTVGGEVVEAYLRMNWSWRWRRRGEGGEYSGHHLARSPSMNSRPWHARLLHPRVLMNLLLAVILYGCMIIAAKLWVFTPAQPEFASELRTPFSPNLRGVPQHPAPRIPKRRAIFNLRQFGGKGDGKTLNTAAFQKAMYAVSKTKGGGVVYVPQGRWLTGSFNLTNHVTLFISKRATILGSQDEDDYPLIQPLPSYGRSRERPGPRHSSLIHGENLQDVAITGKGTIDGQGHLWWSRFERRELRYSRGCLIELQWTDGIIISGLTLKNSPFWTIHPVYCSHVYIHGLKIFSPSERAHNADGIDPDSCDDVLIQDCYISTGDDAIAVKSGWNQAGLAYNRPCKNIVIQSIVIDASHGVSIGSEISGGVSNVSVEHVRISGAQQGLRIKVAKGRGGYVRNVSFRDVWMLNTKRSGIEINGNYSRGIVHADDDRFDPTLTTEVSHIQISQVNGLGLNDTAIRLIGFPEKHFTHLEFEDVFVGVSNNSSPFLCSYIHGTAKNVTPTPCNDLDILN